MTEFELLVKHIQDTADFSMPIFVWVDAFSGFGGVTEGYMKAPNNYVGFAVNHDPYAIESHKANHPNTIHFTEDIRDWGLIKKIEAYVKELREIFPDVVICMHASIECLHFSKAKGGAPRDPDSRTLAEHLEKYLCIKPSYLTIENVEEFLTWGPLDSNGKPDKTRLCESYNAWKQSYLDKGFRYESRLLNAADYGAPTARKRYFGVFAQGDLPIAFPKRTHASRKDKEKNPELAHLKDHIPVAPYLDLHDEGRSIFGLNLQGKEYVDATIERALGGLKKFVHEGVFLSTYYGASKNGQGVYSLSQPCGTLTTKDRFALHHIQYAYGKPTYSHMNEPSQTIMANPKHELVTTKWLFDTQFGNVGRSINRPAPTLIARQDKKPLQIATAKRDGEVDHSIELPTDSDVRKRIKAFMREHGITDVKIRNLNLVELLRVQGFPEDYKIIGGSTRGKKFVGNSVAPKQSEVNAISLYEAYVAYKAS